MTSVSDIAEFLAQFAPPALAAEWDNVGLLVGDGSQTVERVMTCLTITPDSAAEAIEERADLIVTHHPLPFRPLKQIVTSHPTGKLLWDLIRAGIAIHSPHTAFDSASQGINQLWAERLGLLDISPLEMNSLAMVGGAGDGRCGRLAPSKTVQELAGIIKSSFGLAGVHLVGNQTSIVSRIGIACGSGGSMLSLAKAANCDLFVTGEATFHTCLEAEALGIAMILPGHYASERFGVEHLASMLQLAFPHQQAWASRRERDPLNWF